MELSDFLEPDAVRTYPNVASKKRLLQTIADLSGDIHNLSVDRVFSALQEREVLGATGMGKGIAVPHARISDVSRVTGFFIRLETPVDFDAIDRQPVDLVFALLAPEDAGSDHLKALARVSRTLRDETVCRKLRSTDETAALFAILTESPTSQAA